MQLDENKLYEAMGLEVPAPDSNDQQTGNDGAEGSAGTEQLGEDPDIGAEVQSDVGTEGDSSDGDGQGQASNEDPSGGENGERLTVEQRRANAARRRKQEQQAAIDAAVQRAVQAEREAQRNALGEVFTAIGLKNTQTGAPIKTIEEFNAWKAAFDAEKLQKDLSAGKLTPEGLNAAISQHPAVKQAMEIVQRERAAAAAQTNEAAQARISAELQEIQKLDPNIKEVKDLLTMPNAKEFYEKVKAGYSFLDAYRTVNWGKIQSATAAAAAQQAATAARGKEHLTGPMGSRGAGTVNVPAEEMRFYRAMNPGATDAEIQAYYNKNLKK